METSKESARTKDDDPVAIILEKVEEHVDRFEYDVALQLCDRALLLSLDNVEALETSAACLLELGQVEAAKSRLERAVELNADDGRHAKFLSLAQLCDGRTALDLYVRGIDTIRTKLTGGAAVVDDEEKALLMRELSTAHCSVAELFTTDLCFEEDAETECWANIEKAIAADPGNPDAFQAKANFLLIKGEFQASKVAIHESLALWLPKMRDIMEGKLETVDPFEVCPVSYDTRISGAKILIELEDYEPASEVLEGLLSEDDEVLQVWYLTGFMNFLRGEEFFGNARYYLNRAKKVAAKTMTNDVDVLQHVDEILNELGAGDGTDEDDDDEYVDIDDDDDDDDDGGGDSTSSSNEDDKENNDMQT